MSVCVRARVHTHAGHEVLYRIQTSEEDAEGSTEETRSLLTAAHGELARVKATLPARATDNYMV